MSVKQNIKGFTIIEVVLVLAIAGLIFLMVFVALPALQSGQRDTARKQDVGNLGTAINNYSSANNAKLPTSVSQLGTISATADNTNYLTSISKNITAITINNPATGTSAGSKTATEGQIDVYMKARCPSTVSGGSSSITLSAGSARQYVMITKLETGGGTVFCQNS